MDYKYIGALRALGVVVLLAVTHYVGDIQNLSFIANPTIQTIIVAIAGFIEHGIENKDGKAFFGAVTIK